MKHKRKIRSKGDLLIDIVAYGILSIVALICLYPLVYCVSFSISGDYPILRNEIVLLPKDVTFKSFITVFQNEKILNSLFWACYYTVVGTLVQVTATLLYGYVYSRKNFVFRKTLITFTLIPMVFGGGMIPTFLVIKSLGLYGSYWALILPTCVGLWNAMIVKTFFHTTIPDELYDAAAIDGCGQFQTFIQVVLPLSKTIIAIIALYAAVGYWNDYFGPLVYVTDPDMKPLQVVLSEILSASSKSESISSLLTDASASVENTVASIRMKYVLIVVSCAPIIAIYPFMQKYFVKGVMIGSVKG